MINNEMVYNTCFRNVETEPLLEENTNKKHNLEVS